MRKFINRVYNNAKKPFKALANWAQKPDKPGPTAKRWNALKKWANDHVDIAGRLSRKNQRQREFHVKKANELSRQIKGLWNERKRVTRDIEEEQKKKNPDQQKLAHLRERRDNLLKRIKPLDKQKEEHKKQAKRDRKDANHAWQRRKGWIKYRTIYRRRWKAAKKRAKDTGEVRFESWMANGHQYSCLPATVKHVIAVGVIKYDQVVTSTTGGTHAPGSFHYSCDAVDMAGPYSQMCAHQNWIAQTYGPSCLELFGPVDYYYKYGVRYSGQFPAHEDHNHFAD